MYSIKKQKEFFLFEMLVLPQEKRMNYLDGKKLNKIKSISFNILKWIPRSPRPIPLHLLLMLAKSWNFSSFENSKYFH